MPKKTEAQEQKEERAIVPIDDRFIVTMSPTEAAKYPMYSRHALDNNVWQVTALLNNGKNIDVQFTKA